MKPKKIVIVDEGPGKARDPDFNKSYIGDLVTCLGRALYKTQECDPDMPAADIRVVKLGEINREVLSGDADILIFVSERMHELASFYCRSYPDLIVVVLAESSVENTPYLVPKFILTGQTVELIPSQLT